MNAAPHLLLQLLQLVLQRRHLLAVRQLRRTELRGARAVGLCVRVHGSGCAQQCCRNWSSTIGRLPRRGRTPALLGSPARTCCSEPTCSAAACFSACRLLRSCCSSATCAVSLEIATAVRPAGGSAAAAGGGCGGSAAAAPAPLARGRGCCCSGDAGITLKGPDGRPQHQNEAAARGASS